MYPLPAVTIQLPEWARLKKRRRAHVERVASLCALWAAEMGVSAAERDRWLRAATLHDALKDAPEDLLIDLAPDAWDVPGLRHGPAAAERAAQDGETDHGILDAVRYHSVGYKNWDSVGRILYLADYLEPGRSPYQCEQELLLRSVPHDLENVLQTVASQRIADAVMSGSRLLAETTAFWNDLVCGS